MSKLNSRASKKEPITYVAIKNPYDDNGDYSDVDRYVIYKYIETNKNLVAVKDVYMKYVEAVKTPKAQNFQPHIYYADFLSMSMVYPEDYLKLKEMVLQTTQQIKYNKITYNEARETLNKFTEISHRGPIAFSSYTNGKMFLVGDPWCEENLKNKTLNHIHLYIFSVYASKKHNPLNYDKDSKYIENLLNGWDEVTQISIQADIYTKSLDTRDEINNIMFNYAEKDMLHSLLTTKKSKPTKI